MFLRRNEGGFVFYSLETGFSDLLSDLGSGEVLFGSLDDEGSEELSGSGVDFISGSATTSLVGSGLPTSGTGVAGSLDDSEMLVGSGSAVESPFDGSEVLSGSGSGVDLPDGSGMLVGSGSAEVGSGSADVGSGSLVVRGSGVVSASPRRLKPKYVHGRV